MDTLTHALSGALLARATAPKGEPGKTNEATSAETLPLGRRVFVGFAAAAFPDIDVLASYLSPLSYIYHHRGITHSVLMLPLWALLLSLLLAAIWRKGPRWRAYYGVVAMSLGIHILGDLITSFGTIIFAPFSDLRVAWSATFIIDLWFTGIILLGLIASALWRRSRVPAVAGLVVLASYVGLQFWAQGQAIEFGEHYARVSEASAGRVTAVPRPVSPFNWTVIVTDETQNRYAHVNVVRELVRPEPKPEAGFFERLDAAYRPLHAARWQRAPRYGERPEEVAFAREAFARPEFRFFRWFAAYPVLVEANVGAQGCAIFEDLRFVTPGRDATPFRYGLCRDGNGEWQPFQLIGDQRLRVY